LPTKIGQLFWKSDFWQYLPNLAPSGNPAKRSAVYYTLVMN